MATRKPRKPKAQKSEYPTLPGQLGYLNSYYCPVCGKHLFSAYDKDLRKDREDGYYFHVSVISIIAVNAERFWIWTNGSEKKNQRQQVKN